MTLPTPGVKLINSGESMKEDNYYNEDRTVDIFHVSF